MNESDFGGSEVQVKAIFLDYDGTVAPLNVSRSESAVSADRLSILNRISAKISIAVISTKDLTFLVKRTPFAHGWSGLGGLETKIGDMTVRNKCLGERLVELAKALDYARQIKASAKEIEVEEKQDSRGMVVAFSVDWRQTKNLFVAKKQASKILAYCKTLPISITEYEREPFFDIFPCSPDKGKALLDMKKRLGLNDGVLYLGDSVADNSAFQVADIAIGVVHEGTSDDLISEYLIKFDDLPVFLEDLLCHSLCFSPTLSKIYKKKSPLYRA